MRPSLLIIPANETPGVLMPQIPFNGTADFTVSRTTTPANNSTRVNSSGLIKIVNDNVPRIDYLNQSCPALLVEPSAQNLVFQSQNITSGTVASGSQWFDSASLQGTSTSVQNNVSGIIAPDGTQSASLVSMTRLNVTGSTGSSTYVSQIQNLAVSGTYTSTIYIRAKDSNQVGKQINVWQWNGSAIINMILVTLTNDWQRVETTKVSTLPSGNRELLGFGFRQNQGNDLSAEFYVWGAQGELGSVATTYIPTTSAAVSRAADVISASGVSGLIGQTEGTIYVEGIVTNYADAAASFITVSDNSITNRLEIRKASPNLIILERNSTTQSGSTSISLSGQGSGTFKMAVSYISGNTVFFVNGVQVGATNTDTFTMNTLTHVYLGSNATGSARRLNDRIRAAALYTTRLSNDQLAELTRL